MKRQAPSQTKTTNDREAERSKETHVESVPHLAEIHRAARVKIDLGVDFCDDARLAPDNEAGGEAAYRLFVGGGA